MMCGEMSGFRSRSDGSKMSPKMFMHISNQKQERMVEDEVQGVISYPAWF